eukprot:g34406.t1
MKRPTRYAPTAEPHEKRGIFPESGKKSSGGYKFAFFWYAGTTRSAPLCLSPTWRTIVSGSRFHACDIFRFANINLDSLTETYCNSFYLQYLAKWPELNVVVEAPGGHLSSYIMGKVEHVGSKPKSWHGHVTAVTVAPEYRRLGQAKRLMDYLEQVSQEVHNGYFVDLYVRASNDLAISMYKQFGYVHYRKVLGYYSGEEDAFDMRKALKRDPGKESMIPHSPFEVPPQETD